MPQQVHGSFPRSSPYTGGLCAGHLNRRPKMRMARIAHASGLSARVERMNARINRAPPGFVTVAEAAAELTRRGDAIDASNVSRYLARNPEIASEKSGKFRYVDLAALIFHRGGNGQSIAKRDGQVVPDLVDANDEPGSSSLPPGITSEIQQANLRLKQLQVREKEREDQLAEGELVPTADVLSVVTMVMQTFIAELERAEVTIASRHGRVVSSDFRKLRKDAQTKASQRLIQLAQQHLHPAIAGEIAPPPAAEAA